MSHPFEDGAEHLSSRIHAALAKLGIALKSRAAHREGADEATAVFESELLMLMRLRPDAGLCLSEAATALGVTIAAASDALLRLVSDRFARKVGDEDALEATFVLTEEGRAEAERKADLSDVLLETADQLAPIEQELLYRTLLRMIRSMQERGVIPVAKMCVTCCHFRPHRHVDPDRPHHCTLVDSPFGDRHLRVDCSEHETASQEDQSTAWTMLLKGREQ